MLINRRNALLVAGAVGATSGSLAIPASATSQQQTTLLLGVGWEVTDLQNNGANTYTQFTRPVFITGCQLFASMAPTGNPNFGFCEVLVMVGVSSSEPSFVAPPHQYYELSSPFGNDGDVTPAVVNNPNGLTVGGTVWPGGPLVGLILKSMSNQCVYVPISRTNLAIFVPAGGCLVIHVDHAGSSADFEIQGSIEYVRAD